MILFQFVQFNNSTLTLNNWIVETNNNVGGI